MRILNRRARVVYTSSIRYTGFLVCLLFVQAVAASPQALAQPGGATGQASTTTKIPIIDGPPPPTPPDVIRRDAQGRATIRAVRITQPIVVDGRLEEEVYRTVQPISGFLQGVPDNGQPATQKTEAWLFFDDDNIYVSARCWDTAPESEWVFSEMRRDKITQTDNFGVMFDTFYDRRNTQMFYATPAGAWTDAEISNEVNSNYDYNPVWTVKTGRFDGGWTVEMQFPFKSLRYRPGASQLWGVQFRRVVRRRNEWSWVTPLPIELGQLGLFRASTAPTLVGLEVPHQSRKFDLKPYAITRMTSDRLASPIVSNDLSADVGVDVKYGVGQNLTLDVTYNTDLADVEVDEQQINLTRFNLLFPEKRDFFLESRGRFEFAPPSSGPGNGEAPQIFFSRRIGLNAGRAVPILLGSRLTGKVGDFGVALLHVKTGDEPVSGATETDLSVIRIKRDILRRSSIGLIGTRRSVSLVQPNAANTAYGVDATFAFYDNVNVNGYYAATDTPGLSGSARSYQARFDYTGDRYGFSAEHLLIGDAFNPEVGFIRRADQRRTFAAARYSRRPRASKSIRRMSWTGDVDYVAGSHGRLETRTQRVGYGIEFHNSDGVMIEASRTYDVPSRPFAVGPGVTIPAGGYTSNSLKGSYSRGQQHRFAGSLEFEQRGFFGGDQTTVGYSSGRIELTRRIAFEPSFSVSWTELPTGSFTAQVYRTRVNFTFTPTLLLSGLGQFNATAHTVGTNIRFQWEYKRGSELFVTYTDERTTKDRLTSPDGLSNRALAVKVTRLLRF